MQAAVTSYCPTDSAARMIHIHESQFTVELRKSVKRARAAVYSSYDTRQTDEVSDVFTETFFFFFLYLCKPQM